MIVEAFASINQSSIAAIVLDDALQITVLKPDNINFLPATCVVSLVVLHLTIPLSSISVVLANVLHCIKYCYMQPMDYCACLLLKLPMKTPQNRRLLTMTMHIR